MLLSFLSEQLLILIEFFEPLKKTLRNIIYHNNETRKSELIAYIL